VLLELEDDGRERFMSFGAIFRRGKKVFTEGVIVSLISGLINQGGKVSVFLWFYQKIRFYFMCFDQNNMFFDFDFLD